MKLAGISYSNGVDDLLPYQIDEICHALRRDMRSEEMQALHDPAWAQYHRDNARRSRELLETLNPKRTRHD